MPEPQDNKTEPATPKRRQDARERGEVAQSRDVTSVVLLGAALAIAVSGLAGAVVQGLMEGARASWSGSLILPESVSDFHAVLLALSSPVGAPALPVIALLLVAAILGPMIQVGPLISTKALAFRGNRIDPIQGLRRMVSLEKLFDLAKSLIKLAVIVGVATAVTVPFIGQLFTLIRADLPEALSLLGSMTFRFAVAALLAMSVLAIADLVWVRYRHERKLRMTRREVRDELRQQEGSPELKSRVRAMQRDKSRLRMIAEVTSADVVVRNPTHYAVALRYERADMGAPKVVARGRNQVALRILEVAREHGVPIVENPPVARVLYRTTRVGREIPEALYEAIAEILAYVYRVDRRRASAWTGTT